jgi:hypothetical protein
MEVVVVYLKAPSQHSAGQSDENNEKPEAGQSVARPTCKRVLPHTNPHQSAHLERDREKDARSFRPTTDARRQSIVFSVQSLVRMRPNPITNY